MKVVAVIPCHNEEKTIANIVRRVKEFVSDVVVVDNLSTDNTVKKAREAGARIAFCSTVGAGITTQVGVNYALVILQADVIVTLDGDGQHLPEELPLLTKPVLNGQADFVIGERQFTKKNSPLIRRKSVAFTTWLYNFGWDYKLTEAQCGYRAFTSKVAQNTKIHDKDFGFSVETLIKARAKGFKLLGMPVSCIYHDEGVSLRHIPVLWSLIKWRMKCDSKIMAKKLGYKLFNGITRPFLGMGFGKIPGANNIYRFVMRHTIENTNKIIRINNYDLAITIDKDTPIDGISRRLICDHEYEPFTTKIIDSCIKDGMNTIDIGANIGYYTLLMSTKVGESGRVWAFEPEPRNIKALNTNCNLNKVTNVLIENMAVDKDTAIVPFYISQEESGEHSLVKCRKGTKEIQVRAVSLDRYFDSCIPINFIKIDTEGNDANVIKGGKNLIWRYKPTIVTEFWLEGLIQAGWDTRSYCQLIQSLEYKNIYLLDDFKQKISPTDIGGVLQYCQKHNGYSANLLFSAKEIKLD